MPFSRYPRAGCPLAPSLLAPLLDRNIPETGLRLSELDATTWNKFSHEQCDRFGGILKEHLTNHRHSLELVGRKRLTPSRKYLTVDQLELSRRSYNCLSNISLAGRRYGIGSLLVDEVLAIPGFGISSLLDVLTSIEGLVARGLGRHTPAARMPKRPSHSSLRETKKVISEVCTTLGISHVGQFDPRLGVILRSVDAEAKTIGDLSDRQRSVFIASHHDKLCDLRNAIERCMRQTVEMELVNLLLRRKATLRNKQMLARYFGFDRRARETLEAIGDRYDVTRERVRQIVAPSHLMQQANALFLPALDAALRVVHDAIPVERSSVETQLVDEGLVRRRTSLRSIQFAAEQFRPEASFQLFRAGRREWAVAVSDIPKLQQIQTIIRSLVLRIGACRIRDVLQHDDLTPSNKRTLTLVKLAVASMPDVHRLDSSQQWIWSEQRVHTGLRPKIMQVLAACGEVEIGALHNALLRIERSVVDCLPPKPVLLELCRHVRSVRVEGRRVIVRRGTNAFGYLNPREEIIVRLLKKHGPLCRTIDFQEEALEMGIPITAFRKYLRFSLAITRYEKGVYGIVGQKVTPLDLKPYLQLRKSPRRGTGQGHLRQ